MQIFYNTTNYINSPVLKRIRTSIPSRIDVAVQVILRSPALRYVPFSEHRKPVPQMARLLEAVEALVSMEYIHTGAKLETRRLCVIKTQAPIVLTSQTVNAV